MGSQGTNGMVWPAYHDLIAGFITIMTVGAIIVMSILGNAIPDPLLGISSLSVGWLFGRGVQLPIYARVNGSGTQIVNNSTAVTPVPPAPKDATA